MLLEGLILGGSKREKGSSRGSRFLLLGGLLVVSTLGVRAAVASVIYVDDSATGANSGQNWTDACVNLSVALGMAAAGDEVWVAEGTYLSGGGITLPSGVVLYGGFAGNETAANQRNWNVHIATIAGPDFPANDGRVLIATGTAPGTILDGFTIADGYPVFAPGGGLYVNGGTMTVRHCVFQNNYLGWSYGAGLCATNATLIVESCIFDGNYSHLGSGGGMALTGATAATITDCVFSGNTVVTGGSGGEGQGAGIYNESSLPVSVTRCTFDGNIGRPLFICQNSPQYAYGGGIDSVSSGLTVRDCVFRNNQAHYGAGIFAWGNTTIINSVFHHNTATVMCVNDLISAGGQGAAVGGLTFSPATINVIHCTIAANTGREGVGLITYNAMNANLRNTIVWGNLANGEDIAPIDGQIKGNLNSQYSCIQHLLEAIPGEDPPDPANYPGCLDTNPQLVSVVTGNLRLAAVSPCIDAGKNAFVPVGVVTDLDGAPRFSDVASVPDTGVGTPPIVDMGAYEYPSLLLGDLNCDGVINMQDLPLFVLALVDPAAYTTGQPNCDVLRADMNSDGLANGRDAQGFITALTGP